MALNDTKLRNAKPKEKAYKLYDEKGLFIIIRPNGGKWWRYRYTFNGKEKLISLGTYPEISLKEARARRDGYKAMLSQQPPIDPSEAKREQALNDRTDQENTFKAVSKQWIDDSLANTSQSHRERTFRRLEVYVFPLIGDKPIKDITAPDVLRTVKHPNLKDKLETAKRTLQAIGQVFRYAVQHGMAEIDVTPALKGALPTPEVNHMASFTEPQQVGELLRAIDGFTGSFTVECALKLAPLVFVRPSELRRAKWADIDLDAGEWRFLVTKTDTEHIVPLSSQAINILQSIYPYSGHGEFVFMGGHSPKRAMSEAAINAALKRMGYDTKTQITGHGFRAMARTLLHERLGIDPAIIEHQLAHKVPDALGSAYNRTRFLEQRKEMMQEWADYLEKLKVGAEIVPFKQA